MPVRKESFRKTSLWEAVAAACAADARGSAGWQAHAKMAAEWACDVADEVCAMRDLREKKKNK